MNDLLFEPSWWMLAVAAIASVTVWWQGNVRQYKTLKRVGLVISLIVVAWVTVSTTIDTPKETATRKTRQIVRAVSARDWDALGTLIDDQTSFPPVYYNRADVLDGARRTAELIGLKSARVLGMNVEQKDTVILVDFRALSEQDRTSGQQTITDWRFDWQNRGNGWKLYTITPLRNESVGPEAIISNLSRVK